MHGVALRAVSAALALTVLTPSEGLNATPYYIPADIQQAIERTVEALPAVIDSVITASEEREFTRGSAAPELRLHVGELLRRHGHRVQRHRVVTRDGYVLTVHRAVARGPPVLLMHGLLMSADDWVTAGPRSAPALLLAASGYDVWLGNARGNKHSRRHLRLSPRDPRFWDFSWHEIGVYDLPAIIDHVLAHTGRARLAYLAHSQGCTAFFVMASELPHYNDKINIMIGLGPAAAVPGVKSPIVLLLKHLTSMYPEFIFDTLRGLGVYELAPRAGPMGAVMDAMCGSVGLARVICANVAFLLCGFNSAQMNVTNLPVVMAHTPAGASLKQIEHYAQTMRSGRFHKFDYGPVLNRRVYGDAAAPLYRVEAVRAPLALLYSENDWLATAGDVGRTAAGLRSLVDLYRVPDARFNHIDFLYARDIHTLILPKIIQLLQQYNT